MATAKKASAKKTSAKTTSAKKTPAKKTAAKKSAPAQKTARARPDATTLLTKDHNDARALFKKYGRLCKADAPGAERQALAAQICGMLTVHATVEEEIFYPALRAANVDMDLMDEADVEHASAKDMIAQIEAMGPNDDKYDAKVTVLGEYIDHHATEEEDEMFPKARRAKVDLAGLGEQLKARKEALMGRMG